MKIKYCSLELFFLLLSHYRLFRRKNFKKGFYFLVPTFVQ